MRTHDRELTLKELALIMILAFVLGLFMNQDAKAMSQDEIVSIIKIEAKRHGVNPELALAIAQVESRLNPKARGSKGEIGVFQLRPEYHAVSEGDVRNNIRTAIRYLAELKVTCAKYGSAYFVCYNYGPSRHLKHPRQFPYYKRVQFALNKRRQLYLADNGGDQ